MRAQRLTYQLKVSRGVNSTTRFNAFLATTKVYIRARRKGVVIIFLHIIWFRHRALGICSDFETWADDVLVALGFPRGGGSPFTRTRGHDEVHYFSCAWSATALTLRSIFALVRRVCNYRHVLGIETPHFKEQAINKWGRSLDRSATPPPPPWHKAPW